MWCNGIATSRRKGEADRGCVFGCKQGADHMSHYLLCPHVAARLRDGFHTDTDTSYETRDRLVLPCLTAPEDLVARLILWNHVLVDILQNAASLFLFSVRSLIVNAVRATEILCRNVDPSSSTNVAPSRSTIVAPSRSMIVAPSRSLPGTSRQPAARLAPSGYRVAGYAAGRVLETG